MRSGGFAKSGEFARPGTYSLTDDVRATFAAEAEQDETRVDWGAVVRPYAIVAAILVAVVIYVFLLMQVRPFRYWDAVCVVTVAILPAELALACFFVQDHPVAVAAMMARAGARLKGPGDWLQLIGAALVIGIMLPGNIVLYLNQEFDRAPTATQSLVVQQLWSHSNKHGTTWIAGVVPAARSPLRFASFYTYEPIVVPRGTWRMLKPGQSTLTLAVHPGLFGLPWYDQDPVAAP